MSKSDSITNKLCWGFIIVMCYLLLLVYLGVYVFPDIDVSITSKIYNITLVKWLYYPITFFLFLGFFAFRYFKKKAFPKGVKLALSTDKKYLKLVALKNTSISISLLVPLLYFLILNYYIIVNLGLYYLDVKKIFSIESLKYYTSLNVFTSAVENIIATCIIIFISYAVHSVLKAVKYNRMVSKINADINKYIYDSTVIDKPSDIRDDFSKMKKLSNKVNKSNYNPRKYFKKNKLYLALSPENKKPIYIDKCLIDERRHPHISVVGQTGSGKGALTQYIFSQTANMGYCNIAFLPKVDEMLLKQMTLSAKENGKTLHVIDLNQVNSPQFDLLQNCKSHEFDTLTDYLFPYLEMSNEGKNYYAKFSRKVRDKMSLLAPQASCLLNLIELFNQKYKLDNFLNSDGEIPQFLEEFCNLADMNICKTTTGIDFRKLIANGDMLYVICPDMTFDNYKSMLCKALFNRLSQIISERPESNPQRIFWFLDEFPEFVSRPMQKAIEQVRKKGCIFIFNMTSFASLDTTRKDVKSYSFIKSTIVNSSLLVYGTPDIHLAREISDLTGKIPVYKQGMSGTVNDASSAAFDDAGRRFFGDKESLISEGIIAGMPQFFCVYITIGEVAQIAYTGYMPLPYEVDLVNIHPSALYESDFFIDVDGEHEEELTNHTNHQSSNIDDTKKVNEENKIVDNDIDESSAKEVEESVVAHTAESAKDSLSSIRNKAISQAKIIKKPAEDKKIEQNKAANMTKQSTKLSFPKRQNKQNKQEEQ